MKGTPQLSIMHLETIIMANTPETKNDTQSGSKVGFGILGFVVGLFLLLWILKAVLGM